MKVIELGIILNGVTGRMGANQHLKRSLLPIIKEGGLQVDDETTVLPHVVLVGRNREKLKSLSSETGIKRWTTSLDEALSDAANHIYFDSQITSLRPAAMVQAIEAGKHVYCEKPSAPDAATALRLYRVASQSGVKHGVVQDKLWLPGIQKLAGLIEPDFLGRILSVRGEFGYWVFTGEDVPAQRPSWNYRKEKGGGIILDMFPHWHYLLENLFGSVRSVFCYGVTHIPERYDESGNAYPVTAEDAAFATFELEGGGVATINSSWAVRVRRDDLFTLQVDGTRGSAVAGLRRCWIQADRDTPRPVWNPDIDNPIDFFSDWREVEAKKEYPNAFRAQWEKFLQHVAVDSPFPWDLLAGARGVQLAESAYRSSESGCAEAVPPLKKLKPQRRGDTEEG